MDAEKIIDENGNQEQGIDDTIVNGLVVAFADGCNSIRRFIGLQRCKSDKGCAVSMGFADIVLDILESPADATAGVMIEHPMEL